MNTMTIGKRLKTLRTLHNFNITAIANFLEITTEEVRSLENNSQKLKVSQLERLCTLYNVDEDYIVEGTLPENHILSHSVSTADLNTT